MNTEHYFILIKTARESGKLTDNFIITGCVIIIVCGCSQAKQR